MFTAISSLFFHAIEIIALTEGLVARSVLLSSPTESEVEQAFVLARRANQARPDHNWFQITEGMAEYRRANYLEAETLLQELSDDYEPTPAAMAGYVYAMARQLV